MSDTYDKWKMEGEINHLKDEIEALRAENARLREELEALKKFEREKWTGWAARTAMGESDE